MKNRTQATRQAGELKALVKVRLLKDLTVEEIRPELRDKSLIVTGSKEVIIEYLRNNIIPGRENPET